MSNKLPVESVIFDADGTLFNTAELIYAAYDHVAKTHGRVAPTPEQVRAQMGRSLADIMQTFFPDDDLERSLAVNNSFFMENVTKAAAFDGLIDVLSALRHRGARLGILTNGDGKINGQLAHHSIGHYFDSVVSTERVQQPKPHPEGVELALRECNAGASRSIMVGDMPVDIEVAKHAGLLAAVGVTHGFSTRETLLEAGADYIIDSLWELPPLLDTIEQEKEHAK